MKTVHSLIVLVMSLLVLYSVTARAEPTACAASMQAWLGATQSANEVGQTCIKDLDAFGHVQHNVMALPSCINFRQMSRDADRFVMNDTCENDELNTFMETNSNFTDALSKAQEEKISILKLLIKAMDND